MRALAGHHLLRLLGVLCAAAGLFAWIALAWRATSNLDSVTPQSGEGGRLMAWAVTGTVLMIVGAVILHLAVDATEREVREERTPPH